MLMKFEVNRLSMLEVAESVAKVAPSNSHVNGINGILIEGNETTGEVHLTSTNYEVSIQQKIFASVVKNGAMLVHPLMRKSLQSRL